MAFGGLYLISVAALADAPSGVGTNTLYHIKTLKHML